MSLLVLSGAATAHAQSPNAQSPIVVVVESGARTVTADLVRDGLRAAGVPNLALGDENSHNVRETLTVVVRPDGRAATVQFQTADRLEVRFLQADPRSLDGRWLIAPLAGLVRATRAVRRVERREVLDPWRRTTTTLMATEVVDPWAGQPASARLASARTSRIQQSDVLDPWSNEEERPIVTVEITRPTDIVDPWSRERGERLSSPPHR